MRRGACLVGLFVATGCGGSSFSSAGAEGGAPGDATVGDGGGVVDGGSADATPFQDSAGGPRDADAGEAAVASPRCGMTNCAAPTPVCCISDGPSFSCAHLQCGCSTKLECSRSADCPPSQVCCIGQTTDFACPAGHTVAACAASCNGGSKQLCDPTVSTPQCPSNRTCEGDAGALGTGLPPNSGYAACN